MRRQVRSRFDGQSAGDNSGTAAGGTNTAPGNDDTTARGDTARGDTAGRRRSGTGDHASRSAGR